ncbi:MAG: hypothetical protein ACRDRT_01905, partial [Pseudonocardiaceae bacterium]
FGSNGYCLVDLGGTVDSFRAIGLTRDKTKAYVAGYSGFSTTTANDAFMAGISSPGACFRTPGSQNSGHGCLPGRR